MPSRRPYPSRVRRRPLAGFVAERLEGRTPLAAGAIEFGSATYSADLSAGSVQVTLIRTGGATGSVVAGFDVPVGFPASVVFPDGVTSETVTVRLRPLPVAPTYSLTLTMLPPSGGATLGSPSTATVNVTQAVAAGYLDSTFGTEGEAYVSATTASDSFDASLILPNGSSFGAGFNPQVTGTNTPEIALSAVKADGTLNTAFGSGGTGLIPVTAPYGVHVTNIVVQPDGKILVVGYVGTDFVGAKTEYQFMLARFDGDGSPDTTFGKGGLVVAPPALSGDAETTLNASVLSDGQILVVGNVERLSNNAVQIGLKRFNADGALDTTYGRSGTVLVDAPDLTTSAAFQPDGKILVGGPSLLGPVATPLFLDRFNPDGTFDTGFGTGGTVTGTNGNQTGGPILVEPDGDILQEAITEGEFSTTPGVMRYLPGGRVDTFFGSDGFANDGVTAGALALQPDGKILEYGNNARTNVVLARLNADGSEDDTFGLGSMILLGTTDGGYYDGQADVGLALFSDLAVVPGNKILVAGQNGVLTPVDYPGEGLIRYDSAPSPLSVQVEPLIAGTGVALTGVTVARFTDPETAFDTESVTATIDWGDGSTPTAGQIVADPGGGFDIVGTHTYANSGTYPVIVSVVNQIDLRSGEAQGSVVVCGPAVSLRLTTPPPPNVERNAPFGFVITALDATGHVDPNFTGVVTIALNGSEGGTLGGTTAVSAVEGVATFTNLTLSHAGEVDTILTFGLSSAGPSATLSVTLIPTDYLGNGESTPAVFRRVNAGLADWFVKGDPAVTGSSGHAFGSGTLDVPLAGDYDDDGKTDLALYRPSTSQWFVQDSGSGYAGKLLATFGGPNDIPVPGDYDDDFDGLETTDLAVFRPSTGQWFIYGGGPGKNVTVPVTFPIGSEPVPGDYDQGLDGVDQPAVYVPKTSQWVVESPGAAVTHVVATFGGPNDIPVPGAYDALTANHLNFEPAVWRPGTGQYFVHGPDGNRTYQFAVGDIPDPGDYDGIGETEPAVYRPSTGQWLVVGPNGTSPRVFATYGGPADIPTGAPYVYRAVGGDGDSGLGMAAVESGGGPGVLIPIDLSVTNRSAEKPSA